MTLPLTVHVLPTPVFVELDGVLCRVWRGVDDMGRCYDFCVYRVGTSDPNAQALLERIMIEMPEPRGCVK